MRKRVTVNGINLAHRAASIRSSPRPIEQDLPIDYEFREPIELLLASGSNPFQGPNLGLAEGKKRVPDLKA